MWSDSVAKRGRIYCCLTNLCFQIPVISIGIHVGKSFELQITWTLPRLPTESLKVTFNLCFIHRYTINNRQPFLHDFTNMALSLAEVSVMAIGI